MSFLHRKSLVIRIGLVTLLTIILISCNAPATETITPETPFVPTTSPTADSSPTPENTATPTPTEVPLPVIEESSPFTPEQIAFLESEEGKQQKSWVENWFAYWVTAKNDQKPFAMQPIDGSGSRFFYTLIEDIANPGSYKILLEAPEDYPDILLGPPISSWEKMLPPPEAEEGHNIPEGFGPTKLSLASGEEHYQVGIPLGSTLVMENGKPVYLAGGQVVGLIEGECKNWRKTHSKTEEGAHLNGACRTPKRCKPHSLPGGNSAG